MKQLICIIFLLYSLTSVFSQSKKLEKADLLFEQYNYKKALKLYHKLEKSGESPYHVTLRIADCYRLTKNLYQAEQWYKAAQNFPDVTPETDFHMGQTLLQLGKNTEAAEYLNEYFNNNNSAYKSISTDYLTYINFLKSDPTRSEIKNLNINTQYSEFGPTKFNSKLLYSSNKPTSGVIKRGDVRTNESFYNILEADILDLSQLGEPQITDAALNSRFNDGPICFSSNGDLAFITRNDLKRGSKKSQLDIVISKFKDEEWTKEVDKLSTKDKNYSIGHPYITRDLSRLYYISNMPGGYGGMDIYYSEFKNGFLSIPVNLGPTINTAGNEAFPFIADDGILYFSSNGHPGLGGFDIYYATIDDDNYSIAFNMGAPINSQADEMGLFINVDNKTGYFSSNREGGKGNDDIYSFQFLNALKYTELKGVTIGTDQFPLQGSIITIFDANNTVFNEVTTNENGEFSCFLPKDGNFTIECKRRFFKPYQKRIIANDLSNESLNLSIILEKK